MAGRRYSPTQRAVLAHLVEHRASCLVPGSRVLQRFKSADWGLGLQMNAVTPFFMRSAELIEQAGPNAPRYVYRLTAKGRSEAERIGATDAEAEFRAYRRTLANPHGTHLMRY